jgi:hypothetical protein
MRRFLTPIDHQGVQSARKANTLRALSCLSSHIWLNCLVRRSDKLAAETLSDGSL